MLNDKSQYGLITSFVNRYYYELRTYIESRTYLENYERIEKLNSLLNSKGFKIDIEELIILIKEEYENLKYEKFKIKFKDVTLKTFESYSNHLLVHFGENFTDFIDLFSRLLREEKISFNESSLEKSLEHLKEETELSHFEKELGSGSASVSIKDVDKMSGYDFEKFLVILFEKMGYKVEHTQLSKDQGADLIVSKFGERMVIQAKRYNQKVSNSAIQEVVASIRHYKADKGMVVTNNEFTNEAIDLAKSNDITLIDRKQLKEWLTKYF